MNDRLERQNPVGSDVDRTQPLAGKAGGCLLASAAGVGYAGGLRDNSTDNGDCLYTVTVHGVVNRCNLHTPTASNRCEDRVHHQVVTPLAFAPAKETLAIGEMISAEPNESVLNRENAAADQNAPAIGGTLIIDRAVYVES